MWIPSIFDSACAEERPLQTLCLEILYRLSGPYTRTDRQKCASWVNFSEFQGSLHDFVQAFVLSACLSLVFFRF